ncbi:Os08g0419200; hypothetical protein [Desulfatibacillum aliphaticivorans]|uniref:Uncharacterized protein n=1 Tax=Desulfatibacillum aliphaticivorans TaxID=218208 RepID=B8FNK6_DESAL|nr:hypothetical protein [Desulfatibacillum aliphaticivorans]ACL06287.1 Os08g0419200; hypothetical protein [Desulfatibacillum aliphaticivorans]
MHIFRSECDSCGKKKADVVSIGGGAFEACQECLREALSLTGTDVEALEKENAALKARVGELATSVDWLLECQEAVYWADWIVDLTSDGSAELTEIQAAAYAAYEAAKEAKNAE